MCQYFKHRRYTEFKYQQIYKLVFKTFNIKINRLKFYEGLDIWKV